MTVGSFPVLFPYRPVLLGASVPRENRRFFDSGGSERAGSRKIREATAQNWNNSAHNYGTRRPPALRENDSTEPRERNDGIPATRNDGTRHPCA
jgi:hypothetical protein